jgi:hypothetical protein
LEGYDQVLPRWGIVAVLVSAMAALALTLTITTTAAIVVAIFALGAWYRRAHLVLISMATTTALAFLAFGSRILDRAAQQQPSDVLAASVPSWLPQTAQFRWFVWEQQFMPAMAGRWLTGYGGYGDDFPAGVTWRYTESDYITLILRGGVGLMLLVVAFLVIVVAAAVIGQRSVTGSDRVILRVTAVLTALVLPMSLVWPYFTSSGLAQPMWVLLGLAAAVGHAARNAPAARANGQRAPS